MEREHLSRQRWLELVEAQAASELKVDQFCQQHGLAVSTFFGWKRRLKQEGLLADREQPAASAKGAEAMSAERGASATTTDLSTFIELTTSTEQAASPLELVLPGDVVIRVHRHFDPQTLRQVVEALS
jgi:transposase-like protein